MKKSIFKKITAIATCAAMIIPTFTIQNMSASAEEIDFPEYEDIIEGDYISEMGQAITYWANSLVSNSTFNAACTSSTWYNSSSVSDVEVLSRIIYGENSDDPIDRRAVTWIIIHRKLDNGVFYNDTTYRAVVTHPGAFESKTGYQAMKEQSPDDSNWYDAVWLACALLYTSSTSDYIQLFGKPAGITNQLYFAGSEYFYNHSQMNGNQLQYLMDYSWVNVYSPVIVGSTMNSYWNCSQKSTIYNLKSYSKNIFFNI